MLADAGDSMHELFYEGDIAEMLIADLEALGKPPPLCVLLCPHRIRVRV